MHEIHHKTFESVNDVVRQLDVYAHGRGRHRIEILKDLLALEPRYYARIHRVVAAVVLVQGEARQEAETFIPVQTTLSYSLSEDRMLEQALLWFALEPGS